MDAAAFRQAKVHVDHSFIDLYPLVQQEVSPPRKIE
jgi:hypothetical protein